MTRVTASPASAAPPAPAAAAALVSGNLESVAPLTDLQLSMLVESDLTGRPSAYVLQHVAAADGPLDLAALRRALDLLAVRHEVLRSAFLYRGVAQPVQAILARRRPEFAVVDLAGEPDPAGAAADWAAADVARGFDATVDPLLRLAVAQLGPDQAQLIWTYHHIIADGWCFDLLMRDFIDFYERLLDGADAAGLEAAARAAATDGLRYHDWVRQQAQLPDGLEYWLDLVRGLDRPARLDPLVPPEPASGRHATTRRHLGRGLTDRLTAAARAHRVTLNTLVEAAWGLLLARRNGAADVAFGKVTSGRDVTGADAVVGLFVTSVPVRVTFGPATTVAELLAAVAAQAAESARHPRCLLAEVGRASGLGPDLAATLVAFENTPVDESHLTRLGAARTRLVTAYQETVTGAMLTALTTPEGLLLTLHHDPARLARADGELALAQLAHVLASLAGDPATRVAALGLSSQAELERWREASAPPRVPVLEGTVVDAIRARAAAAPEAVALVRPDQAWTRADVDRASDAVAFRLAEAGVRRGDRVAIMAGREPQLIPALLGILKAGAAYVPIDPTQPDERLRHLLADSSPSAVAVVGPVGPLPWTGPVVTLTDAIWNTDRPRCQIPRQGAQRPEAMGSGTVATERALRTISTGPDTVAAPAPPVVPPANTPPCHPGESRDRPPARIPASAGMTSEGDGDAMTAPRVTPTPDDAAYVIFTSGTTGRPKGVVVGHRALANYCLGPTLAPLYDHPAPVLAASMAPTFDAFGMEWLNGLVWGFPVALASRAELDDPEAFNRFLGATGATVLSGPTSLLDFLTSVPDDRLGLAGLKAIVEIGEPLTTALMKRLAAHSDAAWFNHYGPTEATIACTLGRIDHPDWIDIGFPLANYDLYVLDADQASDPAPRPCGVGEVGELAIGGVSLADGYLGAPELTAARFRPNPYGPGRIYLTGDLARWRPDGRVECLGRRDGQIKLRGLRIELGEIEAALAALDGVDQACVTTQPDPGGQPVLVAFYTGPADIAPEVLRSQLAEVLPRYMLPAACARLAAIPQGSSGKANRKALPKLAVAAEGPVTPARDELDVTLLAVLSEALDRPVTSIDADFFDLGGHSLRAAKAVNLIRARTGATIPLRDFFTHTTVRALAQLLRDRGLPEQDGGQSAQPGTPPGAASGDRPATADQPLPSAGGPGAYPLSPAQLRLVAAQLADPTTVVYNLPGAVILAEPLDPERLQSALATLSSRHESLRTSFHLVDGTLRQMVHPLCHPGESRDPEPATNTNRCHPGATPSPSPAKIPASAGMTNQEGNADTQPPPFTPNTPCHPEPLPCHPEPPLCHPERSEGSLPTKTEILRFAQDDREGDNRNPSPAPCPPPVLTVTPTTAPLTESTVRSHLATFIRPFDPAAAPLCRVALLQGAHESALLLDVHHAIADGTSLAVLATELVQLLAGQDLPPTPVQPKDHALWAAAQDQSAAEAFWAAQDLSPTPDLTLDHPRAAYRTFAGATMTVTLPAATADRVTALARRLHVSDYAVWTAAVQALVARSARSDRVVTGCAHHGRDRADLEGSVGMFVATLPIAGRPDPEVTFADFARSIHEACQDAFAHAGVPLERIAALAGHPVDPARNPLFDVMVTLQNQAPIISPTGRPATFVTPDQGVAKFDLSLSITPAAPRPGGRALWLQSEERATATGPDTVAAPTPRPGGRALWLQSEARATATGPDTVAAPQTTLAVEYNTALFDAPTITRLTHHLTVLLGRATTTPDLKLHDLSPVDDQEKQELLSLNPPSVPTDTTATLWDRFAALAHATPHHPAVVHAATTVTYGDLAARAIALSADLATLGVQAGDRIALLLPKQPDFYAALLAASRLGAAWVPLDPAHPASRLAFQLSDAGVTAIVTSGAPTPDVAPPGVPLLDVTAPPVTAPNMTPPPSTGTGADT
ncbi:MAG: condensation domain-containing protein, partial [Propionibacteriaceae bacterium]|nr:condensation domain-containing protein [Propionibacteriaceae bacterium]